MHGRIVNCYAKEDWILGFVHRTLSAGRGIAGMQPIQNVVNPWSVSLPSSLIVNRTPMYSVINIL